MSERIAGRRLCFHCKQFESPDLKGLEIVVRGEFWHIATKQEALNLVDGLTYEYFCDDCLKEMEVTA